MEDHPRRRLAPQDVHHVLVRHQAVDAAEAPLGLWISQDPSEPSPLHVHRRPGSGGPVEADLTDGQRGRDVAFECLELLVRPVLPRVETDRPDRPRRGALGGARLVLVRVESDAEDGRAAVDRLGGLHHVAMHVNGR